MPVGRSLIERSAITFERLVLEAATVLNIPSYGDDGTSVAAVPTDAAHLDLAKRIANDGLQDFYSARDWRFLRPILELTLDPTGGGQCVNGEAWRYWMPVEFHGIAFGQWAYSSSGPDIRILDTSANELRHLRAGTTTTGDPTHAAFCCREPGAVRNNQPLWEAWFYPTPSTALVISRPALLVPSRIEQLDYIPIGGRPFENAMLSAVRAAAELHDLKAPGPLHGRYGRDLEVAAAYDAKQASKTLGSLGRVDAGQDNPQPDRVMGFSYNGVRQW